MTGLVIRWPLIVMFFHSLGVRVTCFILWLVLWMLVRWLNDKCDSIRSRISAGMSDNPLLLFWGVFDESSLTAHLALCLVGLLGVVASGWSLDAAPFGRNSFLVL